LSNIYIKLFFFFLLGFGSSIEDVPRISGLWVQSPALPKNVFIVK
jgi:hypothetical protein